MAEYYSVHNYREFKPFYIATLIAGLPSDSRSIRAITGQKYNNQEFLQMMIVDQLNILVWMQTEDGAKNRNRPKSIFDDEQPDKKVKSFNTSEDFEKERRRLLDMIRKEA